ncbi:MAG: hypothetical protein HY928_01920 [Elusimicrobia bacterium]|nr:hypothetical protein [Elusimicrobiota bacterium]
MSRWAAGFLLAPLTAIGAAAQTYSVETYYPSPAGAYSSLTVTSQTWVARDAGSQLIVGSGAASPVFASKLMVAGGGMAWWSDFHSYKKDGGSSLLGAPPDPPSGQVPPPGRLFYNHDEDKFYYASKDAKAADRASWYKPLGSGRSVLAQASWPTKGVKLPGDFKTITGMSATLGTVECGGGCLKPAAPPERVALLMVVFQGELCHSNVFSQAFNQRLRIRSRAAGQNWKELARHSADVLTLGKRCTSAAVFALTPANPGEAVEYGIEAKKDNDGDTLSGTLHVVELAGL